MNDPSNWLGETWYVDTHAGSGFSNEFDVLIPGSALRALDHDFDRYYFYEKDQAYFDLLCDTIEDQLEVELWCKPDPDDGPPRAGHDDPRIHIMNADSNVGATWLVKNSNTQSHWFTFVDPERFSVTLDLMETLRTRGNMDILFNFQTDAYHRNASEAANHSHDTITEGLGEGWPKDASKDDYVQYYKNEVFNQHDWHARSRKMISEGNNPWRYDLIFASANTTAMGIMGDIFKSPKTKNDVTREINQHRNDQGCRQQSLSDLSVHDHDDDYDYDNQQSSIVDF